MSKPFKYYLFPVAMLYGLAIFIRNKLYDSKMFKSVEFDFPIISVGNLSFGGTGKTPHVEYLIRLLSKNFRVATLSRGYRRKTSGFKIGDAKADARTIGDEPALLKRKYPQVVVAVAEDRELAIPRLLGKAPQTDVILLDDAFQHRSIAPGLSILLTKYDTLFTDDYLLPVGTLREYQSAYKRADFIVVTKCTEQLSDDHRKKIIQDIAPQKGQLVFFSYVKYFSAYSLTNSQDRLIPTKEQDIFLFTGIASDSGLIKFLKEHARNVFSLTYPDHHYFDRMDIENITEAFQNIESDNKVIFTTEKDAIRLYEHKEWILEKKLPIYVLPIQMEFFPQDKELFDSEITDYLAKLKPHKMT